MEFIRRNWDFLIDKLDNRVSVTELSRREALKISNRPLKTIKRRIITKSMLKIWDSLIVKLDYRVSVTKLAKSEDLVISNASLEDIKRGIMKRRKELGMSD